MAKWNKRIERRLALKNAKKSHEQASEYKKILADPAKIQGLVDAVDMLRTFAPVLEDARTAVVMLIEQNKELAQQMNCMRETLPRLLTAIAERSKTPIEMGAIVELAERFEQEWLLKNPLPALELPAEEADEAADAEVARITEKAQSVEKMKESPAFALASPEGA